jgi:hypothetical protein
MHSYAWYKEMERRGKRSSERKILGVELTEDKGKWGLARRGHVGGKNHGRRRLGGDEALSGVIGGSGMERLLLAGRAGTEDIWPVGSGPVSAGPHC